MAAYIYQRLKSSNIDNSGKFAAAAASLKLEILGPFQGNEDDILNFLESQSIKKDNLDNILVCD